MANSSGSTKRLLLILRASGRPTSTHPAKRSLPSTSNTFAIISNASVGTNSPRARLFRLTSSPPRATNIGKPIEASPAIHSIRFDAPPSSQRTSGFAERAIVKDQLETLVGWMVERGILLEEAVTEFEKKFIKRVLDRSNGNQSRAAKVLGIHRNTLSRKVDVYKLDHRGRR